jgi:hypothetical protein
MLRQYYVYIYIYICIYAPPQAEDKVCRIENTYIHIFVHACIYLDNTVYMYTCVEIYIYKKYMQLHILEKYTYTCILNIS